MHEGLLNFPVCDSLDKQLSLKYNQNSKVYQSGRSQTEKFASITNQVRWRKHLWMS